LVDWIINNADGPSTSTTEYVPTYVPSVTGDQLAVVHEPTSSHVLVQRIGRAIGFLARSPEEAQERTITDELRVGALGRLVNMQVIVDALDPDYAAPESHVTFGDLNNAF